MTLQSFINVLTKATGTLKTLALAHPVNAPKSIHQVACAAVAVLAYLLSSASYSGEFDRRPALADNPAVSAGTVINAENVDNFRDWLAPALADLIAQGRVDISVGEFLQLPMHPNYVEATGGNDTTVELGASNGDIVNYVAGRPFPGEPDSTDPRAGEKAAWNMRYGYGPDESETQLMTWRYKNLARGVEERRIEMYGALMRFSHRHTRDPMPELDDNPGELYSALYLKVDFPYDIRNTQLLTHTKKDDAEPEQAWIYLNTQRRVKRLGTGQKTDAFLGSDIMIEDFLGYNGRVRDMNWEYLDTVEVLTPIYAFDQLSADRKVELEGYEVIGFTGAAECFPNITWQPRTVHRVKATPVAPEHPIGHRVFYMDAVTYAPLMTQIYDRASKLWKLGIVALSDSSAHGPENVEWQGQITDGVTMIDLQAERCTTLQFKTRIPEDGLRPKLFTTQQMRSAGR